MHKFFAKPWGLFSDVLTLFGGKTLIYYGIIGVFSATINLLFFAFLYDVFNVNYKLAVTISYFSSVLFNFISNRQITFRGSEQHVTLHLCKYLTIILINYLITLNLVHFVVAGLHFTPYIGVILSIALTATIGFISSRFWVFK